ncbi:MAG: FAD-dependent oxidoreductase [Pseudomonadota bacterium]
MTAETTVVGYPLTFSPIQLGGQRLRNRIIHASMTTRYAREGLVTDAYENYFVSRAGGGAGAIVSEPMNVAPGQNAPSRLAVFDGRALDGIARMVERIEAHDCRFFVQVQDRGRGRHEGGRIDDAYGASPLPDDISWTVPRALTAGEIEAMIDGMAESCQKLAAVGVTGCEISAGHGHLFHQFLSPWSNVRDDDYGGSLENRARLLTSVISEIRERCGPDFAIGVKLPGIDGVANSVDLALARDIAAHVAATGHIDFWSFAWGSHANSLYEHLPDAHGPAVPYVDQTAELRAVAPDIPTGALGYITDPMQGERQIADGKAELVMLARALVTDPWLPRKAAEGREAEIRYCVSCNSCWRAIIERNHLECDNNPRVGRADEGDWHPARTTKPQRFAVVGAGVAGMEAAWILAEAGHEVTVFGRGDEPGGATRLHAELPGGENLSSVYDYQTLRAQKAGARFVMGSEAQLADITGSDPSAVVLATGAGLSTPQWLDADWREEGLVPDLRTLCADFLPRPAKSDGRLVIYDQDHTEMTYAAAEYLSDWFDEVVLITPRERVATDVALVTRQKTYRRLYECRVRIVTSAVPTGVEALEEAAFEYRNVFNGDTARIEDIAAVTFATPRVPRAALRQPLEAAGLPVHVIGDCLSPRTVMAATREGHAIAEQLLGARVSNPQS